MNEAEVTKYLEDFPTVEEIQRKLAANKREKQQLNQMLKIAQQRQAIAHEEAACGYDNGQE